MTSNSRATNSEAHLVRDNARRAALMFYAVRRKRAACEAWSSAYPDAGPEETRRAHQLLEDAVDVALLFSDATEGLSNDDIWETNQ